MSKSLSVWGCKDYEGNMSSYDKSIEDNFIQDLHINFWFIKSQGLYCFDFGLLFRKPRNQDIYEKGAICVFVPFKKRKKDIHDLSAYLCDNESLITAVFNETFQKKENIQPSFVKLHMTNKEPIIMNTQLDSDNGSIDKRLIVKERDDGTHLIFKIKECISNEKSLEHYIRFRFFIDNSELSEIVRSFTPKDTFLKSNLENTDIVDFRVNEQRNLPKGISSLLSDAICTPIKYHFFIIRDMYDDFSSIGQNYIGCRILETETWRNYFYEGKRIGKDDPMIYHWKYKFTDMENRVNVFSAIAKFKSNSTRLKKILAFIFYGVSLSILIKTIPNDTSIFSKISFIASIIYVLIIGFLYFINCRSKK